jgi:RimJ/RimL family protein N-acetyltransferase
MVSTLTIETQRTLLRAFREEDAPALFDITRQPIVMQYITHPHRSIEETLNYIRSNFIPHYQKYDYGRLAVIDKNTQTLIGYAGLKYLEDIKEIDLAYLLHPDFWGKGIATEVTKACLSYAKSQIKATRIISLATPNNRGSLNVLNKVGMHYERNRLYWGEEFQQWVWLNKIPS